MAILTGYEVIKMAAYQHLKTNVTSLSNTYVLLLVVEGGGNNLKMK